MKKIIFTGVAISVALIAGQVEAANLSLATVNASTNKEQAWYAGSSAATPFLEKAFFNDCTTVLPDQYTDGNRSTYVCEANATYNTANGFTAPHYLIAHKLDQGGSITGVKAGLPTPVVPATYFNLGNLQATASTCVAGTLFNKCTATAPGAFTFVDSPATGVTNANFSDVEPLQFGSPLNGAVVGATSVPASGVKPVASQVFGIVVNKLLRDAMQDAMVKSGVFGVGSACNPTGAALPVTLPGTTTGIRETEACMVSLTTEQITSLFASGHTQDFLTMTYGPNAAIPGDNLYDGAQAANQPSNFNTNVHVCSRTPGSGTLATLQAKFENAPCVSGSDVKSMVGVATATPEAGVGKFFHAGAGSGNVEDCLESLDQGFTKGTFTPYPSGTSGVVDKRWAIGIMGTERNASNAKNYRFVKIDGVSPDLKNVVSGKYKYWADMVTVGNRGADKLTADLLTNMSNPTQLSTLNVTNVGSGILTGFLGYATNPAFLPDVATNAAFSAARPVNPWTSEAGAGGSLNICRFPAIPNTGANTPAFRP